MTNPEVPVFIELVDAFRGKIIVNTNTICSIYEMPYGTFVRTTTGTYIVQMSVREIDRLLRIANQLEVDK